MDNREKVNCIKCKYFVITWQPQAPRGCSLHGFKTAQMPSAVVLRSSGEPCRGFEPKFNDGEKDR